MIEIYTSLDEAPLDDPPPDVGDWMDDGSHVERTRRLQASSPESFAPGTSASLIVPFTREIKAGSTGRDVIGLKRSLWRALGRAGLATLTPVFGRISVRLLKEFQHEHGLSADGVVGPATLRKLAPFFDRYAFYLYEGYRPGQNPMAAKRARMLAYLVWGYNQRALIYYLQARPMTLLGDLYHLPVSEDCSTFYTKGAKAAGWQDPNGFGFNGVGNTVTLRAHGRLIDVAHAEVGDGVFYSNPEHVGGYVGGGRIISLGSSAGPSLTSAYYRRDLWQARTYL